MFRYFAHNSGEPHIETVETSGLIPFVAINVLPFALLALIWLLMIHVFRTKPATRLSITMAYLLVVGLTMFQVAPVASIVALITGFALALGVTLLQAKH